MVGEKTKTAQAARVSFCSHARESADQLAQLQHLQVWWTVLPVMPPADDQVALARVMAVLFELEAFIFKLDAEVLPASGFNFNFGFAVGES